MIDFEKFIGYSADPDTAEKRFEQLMAQADSRQQVLALSEKTAADLINIISLSDFLYRFIRRHPDCIQHIGETCRPADSPAEKADFDSLRLYKYRELLKIAWMDISTDTDYRNILHALSHLAETIVNRAFELSLSGREHEVVGSHLSTFALGKLGAEELNFSSDIDLIFVCSNPDDVSMDVYDYQQILLDSIRTVSNRLEQGTAEGFLYRVDLNLRPWGKSGPLVMSIDETENYYEASSEAWERFAWLRGRNIAGPDRLGEELTRRLHPFIYRRSLSSDDLDRFVEIKNEMFRARRRKGYWNVKVGEGGIRDLEFFIQMLQLVNAPAHPELQNTGTLNVLAGLKKKGLIGAQEFEEISHSYLFLRRLENRLQMVDEQQTHELPDAPQRRLVIARSMGIPGESDNEVLDNFETELFANRSIARSYFDRILPGREN